MNAGPIPVFPQGPDDVAPYTFVPWPQWFFHPEPPHKGEVFNSEVEVPDGWLSGEQYNILMNGGTLEEVEQPEPPKEPEPVKEPVVDAPVVEPVVEPVVAPVVEPVVEPVVAPAKVPHGAETERQLTAEQRTALINELKDNNNVKSLISKLELLDKQVQADGGAEIEYMSNWPKKKLAETLVDNGYNPEG